MHKSVRKIFGVNKMNFNRRMHPRNFYRNNPPNFAELALQYPDFRQHCAIDIYGKVNFNFKNPDAIRALTNVLLKKDFGLSIEIPPDSLVPRIPGRLNYIHWLQDLAASHFPDESVRCIDIGSGASCIYPLLGAKVCGWKFIAVEKLPDAIECARKNVMKNNLQNLISVVEVDGPINLYNVVEQLGAEMICSFCMCNPPFFDSQRKEGPGNLSFPSRRPAPHSCTVGRHEEMFADGGEVHFVKRIINDSERLRKRVRYHKIFFIIIHFTKHNHITFCLFFLESTQQCLERREVTSMCETVFCQGKTQRWAVAWTFDETIHLQNDRKLEKMKEPVLLQIPKSVSFHNSVECTAAWLESVFENLSMFYKRHDPVCNVGSSVRFVVEAYNNTWSHSRRKRRALRHAEGEAANKISRKSHCVTHDVGVNCTTMVELFSDEEQNFNSDVQGLQIMQNEQKQSSSSTGIDKFVQTEKSQPSFAVIKFEVLVKEMVAGLEIEFIFIDGKSPEMLSHIVQYFKNSMNALV
ncbi:Methyltransferase-like protein 16 [Trichinella britovi]|uniref:U6 small nuclear RNA (adenine-(43)-N(6))-methyltransferase n=1 Tax=Trichinella britovi TaxID=45882 RepID=A0A0V1DIK1_TRIBR|nr:Methyltransferase-like protein 16 [Trichinella britovi]